MPSRPPPPSLPLLPTVRPPSNHHHPHHLLLPILAASLALPLLLLFLSLLSIFLYRRFYLRRTAPTAEPKSPHHLTAAAAAPPLRRFSYSLLRRATASFSPSTRLGHGAFGSVHKAVLPGHPPLAVKAMDPAAASLQGHQEFNTELSLAAVTLGSPQILSLLGYSANRRGSRRLLVYELMPNRSLQECLLETKSLPLSNWSNRFAIAVDVARGLEYLHHSCNPPVIHGDIKPSNVLLDGDFRAKIGDFGLARLKTEEEDSSPLIEAEGGDNRSILEETESVATGLGEDGIEQSPESCCIRIAELSPEVGGEDGMSVESGGERKAANSRRDWWWRHGHTNGGGGGGGAESVKVKDYVMEWIGTQIKKERPWNESSTPRIDTEKEKKNKKKWKWWATLDDDDDQQSSSSKKRKPREWWKEEFCDELSKKKKKKKKIKTRNSNSKEETFSVTDEVGGRMSGGVSSTPSMRGTICYIAPEYGSVSRFSEKCDVYSFGVLLLVLVSGRRPLQVTSSPMSQFERANLISWARQLASSSNGKLLDLVDGSLNSLEKEDKEQALLCITVALLCLQRSPAKRPTMKDVVGMLSGEGGGTLPQLPFEFSPSPPSNFQFKSGRRKAA